jgi:hypothetical protein
MSFWDGSHWVAEETAAPARASGIARRLLGATAEAGLITALLFGLIASGAFAAKGGGSSKPHGGGGSGGTGTISLAPLVYDANGNGVANWGDTVTFNVSTNATTQPWVNLVCSQNGVVVAQGWDGYFVGSLTTRNFGLYSPQWSSGAADCVAYLTTPTWSRLGSTSFHVDP